MRNKRDLLSRIHRLEQPVEGLNTELAWSDLLVQDN
jgi:hypothetical protein